MQIHRLSLLLASFVTTASIQSMGADTLVSSYQTNLVGQGFTCVAWHFAPKTVSVALTNSPNGTTVYHWDVTNQDWIINGYDFGTWTYPNVQFKPGDAFLIYEPSAG